MDEIEISKFVSSQNELMELSGFWKEDYKSCVITQVESNYKTEHIRVWGISDIIFSGDKALIKWYKRYRPLTKEELKKQYGK